MTGKSEGPVIEVNLLPGELYFGSGHKHIKTLLGSCVAITLFHPERRVGGMCHYQLPYRSANSMHKEGYFADDTLEFFKRNIKRLGTTPDEYEVKIFGGGQMFANGASANQLVSVSRRNVEEGLRLLNQYGFRIKASDVGGRQYRKIKLDLWTGSVWVQYGEPGYLEGSIHDN